MKKHITNFSQKVGIIHKEETPEIITENDDYCLIKKGHLYGVSSKNTHIIVPPQFYGVKFNNGVIEVQKTENGEYEPYEVSA